MKLVWVLGLASVLVAAAPSGCDVSRAYKILEGVSTARRFCSSLLYPHGICTHTTTTTTKIGPTSCVDKTKTKTERDVYTETFNPVYVLPSITRTLYASTVFQTLGTTHPVDKRSPQTAAAAQFAHPNPTPTALSTCPNRAISGACSSVVPEPTVTVTATKTKGKACTDTITITTTNFYSTTTTTSTITATPPRSTVNDPGVTTTAVPAECLGPTFGTGPPGDGDTVLFDEYPFYDITGIECCARCYKTPNCVASIWTEVDECERLIRQNATTGVSAACPLGVEDFPFGNAGDGHIYPGPCGR